MTETLERFLFAVRMDDGEREVVFVDLFGPVEPGSVIYFGEDDDERCGHVIERVTVH